MPQRPSPTGDIRMGEDLAIPDEREGEEIGFTLDGRRMTGREGDTVASALHASGVRVLYRSVRYHRPRGYFCGVGKCAHCLMRVDGEPNVRACTSDLEEGMEVESQKGWPSARRDVLGLVDRIFPDGFDYHERFIRPKILVPLYNAVIRRLAGFGDPPDPPSGDAEGARTLEASPDVAVVGAGPAGLAAAREVADAGRGVVLLEERPRLGGELRLHREPLPDASRWSGVPGPEAADDLADDLRDRGSARVLAETPVLGVYPPPGDGPNPTARDDGDDAPLVVARGPDALWELSPDRLVLAPGTYEAPIAVPNNDLPGVMGARAAHLLLDRGVRPGKRAVVAGAGPRARRIARRLDEAGVDVAAVAGARAKVPAARPGADVVGARGSNRLEAVTLAAPAGEEEVDCDVLVAASGRYPRPELLQQARVPFTRATDDGALYPQADVTGSTPRDRVWVAGEAAHPMDAGTALRAGRAAGLEAAASLGARADGLDRLREDLETALGDRP